MSKCIENQATACESIPDNERFKMVIGEIFRIGGGMSVLVGTVEVNAVSNDDVIDIFDENGELIEGGLTVNRIETKNQVVEKAEVGEAIGIKIRMKFPQLVKSGCYVKLGDKDVEKEPSPRYQYIPKGLCAHCGGMFKGVFGKKCSLCGKPKDY